jgi:hypothetical protein
MYQLDLGGMQEVARQGQDSTRAAMALLPWLEPPRCAIQRIAHDRMPDGREVHSDLVRPACLDLYFQQCELPIC